MNNLQERFDNRIDFLKQKYRFKLDKVAVAVSGGADSLALALLLFNYFKKHDGKMVVLTVNHQLRPSAAMEADYVAKLMQQRGIEHYTLLWDSNSPKSGIEEKAREARYCLLLNWCKENAFEFLLTAHHLYDQAETFIMRLQRGSGVDGLASIQELSCRDNILLLRPLLDFLPQELQGFLQENKIDWVKDESNDCDDFLRVRIRKLLPLLQQEIGLSAKRIANTAEAMGDVREYFSEEVEKFLSEKSKFYNKIAYSFAANDFAKLHKELQWRLLAKIIRDITQKPYQPTFEELSRLSMKIVENNFKGATLGGAELICFDGKLWLVKENKLNKISKKQWEDFVKQNPLWEKMKIPYKMKISLLDLKSPLVFAK